MKRRLQNKIAESTATLPVVCVATTLLWWLPQGTYSTDYLLGWLVCALTAYVVIETSATCRLLRVRSRMVSSLLLLIMAVCGFLHPLQASTITLFCTAASFYFLLQTYEQFRPEADTWHAYLLLSLASLLWPPVLLLTPVLLWNQKVYLRSLRWKSLAAAVIGLIHPYLLWATGAFALNGMETFTAHATGIIAPLTEPFWWQWIIDIGLSTDWDGFWSLLADGLQTRIEAHVPETVATSLLAALALTGGIHYTRKSYDDKISVRMSHYCFLTLQWAVGLWFVLQPNHFQHLFPLLLLATAPSAAHFIALTHTKWTNAWTMLLAIGLIGVGIVCLVLPSPFVS